MKYIQGDLIQMFKENKFDMIGHQCNCFLMGAGIAGALVKEFPEIEMMVNNLKTSVLLFGRYYYIKTDYGYILNIYSQFNPGGCMKKGIDSFEVRLAALENCLTYINDAYRDKHIGLPLIASGIAKQKSNLDDLSYFHAFIEPSVMKCLKDMEVTIVYL